MSRKIVQITSAFNKKETCSDYAAPVSVYALCDDGTVWKHTEDFNGEEWTPLKPIPRTKLDWNGQVAKGGR